MNLGRAFPGSQHGQLLQGRAPPSHDPGRKVAMKRISVAALLLSAAAAAVLAVALPLLAAFSKPGTDPEPDADEATA